VLECGMQSSHEGILYSPTDLVNYFGCRHAVFLDVNALHKKNTESGGAGQSPNNMRQLMGKMGLRHEKAYLKRLEDEGRDVEEIRRFRGLKELRAQTLDAMKSARDVIYQAVLVEEPWLGYADFLIRCDRPSELGGFSYEVLDTKLARTAGSTQIMQLCVYSELISRLQGFRPVNMHLLLGNGEKRSFRVADFIHYYSRAKRRFEEYVNDLPAESYPEPCSHCRICRWHRDCKAQWERNDHLCLVANIKRSQMDKLRRAGIRTVAELAGADPGLVKTDLNRKVFQRLRSQAGLQHQRAKTGEDIYVLIPFPPGRGLSRIPLPDDGDLFFDMEGDPLYPHGLEYLFGVYYLKNTEGVFRPFWAHDHEEERETFEKFMAFLADHLSEHPHAHIYHYNHYETTALKRLACRYTLCEEQLDNLLRTQKFVDLYQVVRESIRTSEPGYSIKNLETFYMDKREGEVATAVDSIIVYNTWRETDADEAGKDRILKEIADYNEIDCVSTKKLRDWLITLHREPRSEKTREEESETKPKRRDWEIEYEEYRKRLGAFRENPPAVKERLVHLLEFHNREAKSLWWGFFDRQSKSEDELIEDAECVGGMRLGAPPVSEKRSLIYTYRFPPQEYKLRAKSEVYDVAKMKGIGRIVHIDEDARRIQIKRGARKEPLPESLSIGPPGPIDSKDLRSAIYLYADHVLKAPERPHVATEILSRNVPRVRGKEPGEAIIGSEDLLGDSLKAILALDSSYLFIQGPPGAGKTYISSHIIVELMKRGKKIGVASNTHRAIHRLLEEVENVASARNVSFHGVKKASGRDNETYFEGKFIHSVTKTDKMSLDGENKLFAGTAWTFANSHFVKPSPPHLDYLFIDEAGQVATANVVAMASSARNIILVGDQMQLAQPIQGIHPGEAGLSVLEFLLGDHSTIPAERGIFLGETRRMHPSICQFISDAFYEGRLTAHESTKTRGLNLRGMPNEGIVLIPAVHEGCSQRSVEEGRIIKAAYQALKGRSFTDRDGSRRFISKDDILVLAPYNVQVNYLRSILPENARVGTVDKFQGQEAPIVLISMATSSPEEMPRNIEFLFSRNRLNVAISRAQCLAVVVASPKLMEIQCETVEQMKLVNTFCWLDEYAEKHYPG